MGTGGRYWNKSKCARKLIEKKENLKLFFVLNLWNTEKNQCRQPGFAADEIISYSEKNSPRFQLSLNKHDLKKNVSEKLEFQFFSISLNTKSKFPLAKRSIWKYLTLRKFLHWNFSKSVSDKQDVNKTLPERYSKKDENWKLSKNQILIFGWKRWQTAIFLTGQKSHLPILECLLGERDVTNDLRETRFGEKWILKFFG